MKGYLIFFKLAFGIVFYFPHLIICFFHQSRSTIIKDTLMWLQIRNHKMSIPVGFVYLIVSYPEFRTLFYSRIGKLKFGLQFLWPGRKSLLIGTKNIKEGLYIHLGYSTVIGAKSIGKNCKIYQQVTIGSIHGAPTILDNVTIFPGAIIIGNITIGNNVVIGVNASIYQNVPDNTTVYPPTSIKMKWKAGSEREQPNDIVGLDL